MYHRHGVDVQFLVTLTDSITAALETLDPSKPSRFVFVSGDELSVPPEAVKKDKKKGNGNSSSKTASPLANPVAGTFVLSGPSDKVNNVKESVCGILSGRGGGKPGRLQGQAQSISLDSLENVKKLLQESII